MPSSWSGRDTQTLSAAAMSALLLASAAKHFDDPGFFAPVVPDFLCRDDSGERTNSPLAVLSREEWVALSAAAESVWVSRPEQRDGMEQLNHSHGAPANRGLRPRNGDLSGGSGCRPTAGRGPGRAGSW